jgi:hypothetical protein
MQLRVIMCCCMWCSTWLFWRLGPMIIYLPAWSSFVPRIFSSRSSYSASLQNHISIKTRKLCNDLFAWTKKKRDLRIVFTGSCADLLRHGLLMLMFLDGTCQASELDGSSTLILFMMSMVISTTQWELCSRSTPKKFVLHSSGCAPHRLQTCKWWNLIKSCKKLAIAADAAATSWPNWRGRLLETAHNPPGIMAVLRVDDRGSQLSNTPFSYMYIYIFSRLSRKSTTQFTDT